ncbi:MAG: aminotransferase class V-fold PLP-dependent enzyme [Alphaproteobacteria bacterium]|nr:MAG: aminotransferase class V-fold PLP-dependent enzyme [Alphaproteobacteria bacterium]
MFSSGPTRKYDEFWVRRELLFEDSGRSHLSDVWINKIRNISSKIRQSLQIPNDYQIAFVNGSATGVMDAIFFNMLGNRPCHVLVNGVFSNRWSDEILNILKIPGKRINEKELCDIDPKRDFIFAFTETANGTKWFDSEVLSRIEGLRVCDATSAVFAENIDWECLDCTGFSFQKALGAEAGIGCIVLSPKAFELIDKQSAKFPVPRFIKLSKKNFEGILPNTPSLLSLNDLQINLDIFLEKGGLSQSILNCKQNRQIVMKYMSEFIDANEYNQKANAVLCLVRKGGTTSKEFIADISLLAESKEIFDIAGHPMSDPCLRIWIGPTISAAYLDEKMSILAKLIESVLANNQ